MYFAKAPLQGLIIAQFDHSVLSAIDSDLFDYLRGSFLSTFMNQFLCSLLAMLEPTFRLKYKELKMYPFINNIFNLVENDKAFICTCSLGLPRWLKGK